MARIAFFTENLPPDSNFIGQFSYDLILSLADQQHDIRVFSTYREGAALPPPHPRIEVLRPFRKWSWLELPQMIPLLMQFHPDIIHIIQPHDQALSGWTNAMNALPGFKMMLGDPLLVSSFYNLEDKRMKAYRLLLKMSDVVTVANQLQQSSLQESGSLSHHQILSVLPVNLAPKEASQEDESADMQLEDLLARFLADGKEYVFIPGPVDRHEDLEHLFKLIQTVLERHQGMGAIIGGGWGALSTRRRQKLQALLAEAEVDARFLLTGPLPFAIESRLLSAAQLTFVATLRKEDLYYTYVVREAVQQRSVLFMNSDQASLDPLPWSHLENAFIATGNLVDLQTGLLTAIAEKTQRQNIASALSEFSRTEVIDHPANIMSRLYVQGLARREGIRHKGIWRT